MNPEQPPHDFEKQNPEQPDIVPEDGYEPIEIEISPEILERLKAKTQDINKKGNGVTALRCGEIIESLAFERGRAKLTSVLENGLLGLGGARYVENEPGLTESEKEERNNKTTKERWAHQARKDHRAFFFANIIGRDIENVADSIWAQHAEVTFVFDLKHFKPAMSMPTDEKARPGTYRPDAPPYKRVLEVMKSSGIDPAAPFEEIAPQFEEVIQKLREIHKDDWGKMNDLTMTESIFRAEKERYDKYPEFPVGGRDWGFTINHRIAPRKFIGLVLNPLRPMTQKEREVRYPDGSTKLSPYEMTPTTDPIILEEDINILVKQMAETYKGKEHLILPIYDREGNLIWPEKVSYEDIQKREAERTPDTSEKGQ